MLEELWGVVLPDELVEPWLPEVDEPVLLLLISELLVLDPVLLPPGVKAAPVAELAPESPKYENTL